MEQKVLVVGSVNLTPEEKINEELAQLGPSWKVISAVTVFQPVGQWTEHEATCLREYSNVKATVGMAQHVYYVTTVIVAKD